MINNAMAQNEELERKLAQVPTLMTLLRSEIDEMKVNMRFSVYALEGQFDDISQPCLSLDCAKKLLNNWDMGADDEVDLWKELHNLNEVYEDVSEAWKTLVEKRESSEWKKKTENDDRREQLQTMEESLNKAKEQNEDLERKLARASSALPPTPPACICIHCSLNNFGFNNFCVMCRRGRGGYEASCHCIASQRRGNKRSWSRSSGGRGRGRVFKY